jgi:nitrous oxidase accessory protein NosD
MKFLRSTIAVIAIGAMATSVTSTAASAKTTHVMPGQSIQAAVDAAEPGDTIRLAAGTFHESVLITKPLRLMGSGHSTVLEPGGVPNDCTPSGICVFSPGGNVSIKNLTVRNFEGFGVVAFSATEGFTVTGVRAIDDGEYGIAAFESHGIAWTGNFASNALEAGFYVGDTPDASAKVTSNTSVGSAFGFFLRDSRHGVATGNVATGNCIGILGLDTGEEPDGVGNVSAGDWRLAGNKVSNNTKACPANEEAPPLSGVGIALLGPDDYVLSGNKITGNTPSGETAFSGGVVVLDSTDLAGGTTPNGNVVRGNIITGNDPDILYDGSGSGNVFAHNNCSSSVPPDLC